MTATDTATAEAAVTGITDEQLTALQSGGWGDNDAALLPAWKREFENGERMFQWIFPSNFVSGPRWIADSRGEGVRLNSLDEALAWCDERAGGGEPAEAGSATKQEDRFALLAGGE